MSRRRPIRWAAALATALVAAGAFTATGGPTGATGAGGDLLVTMDLAGRLAPGAFRLAPVSDTVAIAVSAAGRYVGMGDTLVALDKGGSWPPIVVGGSDALGARLRAIAATDDLVLVAAGAAGLSVHRIAASGAPTQLAALRLGGEATDVAVFGDHAAVAAGPGGLVLVDISEPAAPRQVGQVAVGAEANGVTMVGKAALVAAGTAGLVVVDVTDAANPRRIGAASTPGRALSVASSPGQAVVGDDTGTITGFRVANPSMPTKLFDLDGPAPVLALALDRDTLAGAYGEAGVMVYPLTVGQRPGPGWLANTPGRAQDLHLDGQAMLVADGAGGLHLYSINNRLIGTFGGVTDVTVGGGGSGLARSGDTVYVGLGKLGLLVLDVSDPVHPFAVNQMPYDDWINSLTVAGDRLYVAGFQGGITEYTISLPRQPSAPVRIRVPAPAVAMHVMPRAGTLAVAAGMGGLWLMGEGGSTSATVGLPGWSSHVALDGDHAFVAAGSHGLQVVSLAGAAGPSVVAAVATLGWSGDVELRDGLAFVADGSRGLAVIDVSNPSMPVEVGRLDTPFDATDVELRDGLAFLADNKGGLWAIDVRQPAAPRAAGHLPMASPIHSICLDDGHVYAADAGGGFSVVRYAVEELATPTEYPTATAPSPATATPTSTPSIVATESATPTPSATPAATATVPSKRPAYLPRASR